jgi:hypothetical protein
MGIDLSQTLKIKTMTTIKKIKELTELALFATVPTGIFFIVIISVV